jgi:hypothetical protein
MSSGGGCPKCGAALSRPNVGQPWCPRCEWNLGRYDPEVMPPRGWRWLDRLGHRAAFRMDRGLFDRLRGTRPAPPGWTLARMLLTAVSALLVLLTLACAVAGVWLITLAFPSFLIVLGGGLLLLAYALRPRLGRAPQKRRTLRRDQSPTLFGLIDRVAAASGAAVPDVIAVEPVFNANTRRFGIRQRSVLGLGIPLWCTLGPGPRVALLAHELAHSVNGDPTRALLIRPALDTFRMLAEVTGAKRPFEPTGREKNHFINLLSEMVLWVISRVLLLVHVGLRALAARDHQTSEYLADGLAAEVAGRDAMIELMDRLVLLPEIETLIAYNAGSRPPSRWRAMAESLQTRRMEDQLPQLRQLSLRETSLWSSHPPTGLRIRMIESRTFEAPRLTLSDEESARIDDELAGWYGATQRLLAGRPRYGGTVTAPL